MLINFPIKVLIIDDDVTQTTIISQLLKGVSDVTPVVFNDPLKAMAAIEAGDIRIVITDLKMEGLSGEEIIKRCADLQIGMQILVVTGGDNLVSAIRCMNEGARKILRKPIVKKELIEAVTASVERYKQFNETIRAIGAKRSA